MATLQNIVDLFKENINRVENKQETDALLNLVLEHVLSLNHLQWVQHLDEELAKDQISHIKTIMTRLEKHEPIQYILNEAHFYDLIFKVNPSVLIPRQETEELVHWIIEEQKHFKTPISILDMGTGSGCIPIALKKNLPMAHVFSCDISEEALSVAKRNAKENGVEVTFFKTDILEKPILPLPKFDIIVSNPPYVTNREKKEIRNNVLNNEPHLALFVSDENPLLFYKKIADLATQHLQSDGNLFFEINQYLGKETEEMLQKKGFNTQLKKDLNNNDRMMKAWF